MEVLQKRRLERAEKRSVHAVPSSVVSYIWDEKLPTCPSSVLESELDFPVVGTSNRGPEHVRSQEPEAVGGDGDLRHSSPLTKEDESKPKVCSKCSAGSHKTHSNLRNETVSPVKSPPGAQQQDRAQFSDNLQSMLAKAKLMIKRATKSTGKEARTSSNLEQTKKLSRELQTVIAQNLAGSPTSCQDNFLKACDEKLLEKRLRERMERCSTKTPHECKKTATAEASRLRDTGHKSSSGTTSARPAHKVSLGVENRKEIGNPQTCTRHKTTNNDSRRAAVVAKGHPKSVREERTSGTVRNVPGVVATHRLLQCAPPQKDPVKLVNPRWNTSSVASNTVDAKLSNVRGYQRTRNDNTRESARGRLESSAGAARVVPPDVVLPSGRILGSRAEPVVRKPFVPKTSANRTKPLKNPGQDATMNATVSGVKPPVDGIKDRGTATGKYTRAQRPDPAKMVSVHPRRNTRGRE